MSTQSKINLNKDMIQFSLTLAVKLWNHIKMPLIQIETNKCGFNNGHRAPYRPIQNQGGQSSFHCPREFLSAALESSLPRDAPVLDVQQGPDSGEDRDASPLNDQPISVGQTQLQLRTSLHARPSTSGKTWAQCKAGCDEIAACVAFEFWCCVRHVVVYGHGTCAAGGCRCDDGYFGERCEVARCMDTVLTLV